MRASADHITCAKVLIFVTLFTWSATIVATTELRVKDFTPGLKAVSRQRSLKSENTDGTGSNHADEERAPPLVNAANEGIGLDRVMNQFLMYHLQTMDFAPPFDVNEKKFLESEYFLEWVGSVYQKFGNTAEEKEKALTAMLVLLAEELKGDLAVDIFAATEIGRTKDIATKLLNILHKVWVADKRSPEEVFKFFKLDQTEGNPFEYPQFVEWVRFCSSRYKYRKTPELKMLECLANLYSNDGNLFRILVKGSTIQKTSEIAERLMKRLARKWIEDPTIDKNTIIDRLTLVQPHDGVNKRTLSGIWRSLENSEKKRKRNDRR